MEQSRIDALNKAFQEEQERRDELLKTDGLYAFCMDRQDVKRIDKLSALTCKETFWDDVRKLCRNVTSDRAIGRWQGLAELRYRQLELLEKAAKTC